MQQYQPVLSVLHAQCLNAVKQKHISKNSNRNNILFNKDKQKGKEIGHRKTSLKNKFKNKF